MTYTNKATSGFSAAYSLTGEEIVGIVQSGSNVRTTLTDIRNYAIANIGYGTTTNLAIGSEASANTYGVALGVHADVRNTKGIAIGYHSYAAYDNTVAIGTSASTTGVNDVAIGANTHASYTASIAIGLNSVSGGNLAVGIGAFTQTAVYGVAIGGEAHAVDRAIAIGYKSYATNSYSITIGYRAQASEAYSIAIGSHAYTSVGHTLAIGPVSVSGTGSIAISTYAAHCYGNNGILIGYSNIGGIAHNSVVIGNNSYSHQRSGIAIGSETRAIGYSAIAIGYNAIAANHYTISLGAAAFCNQEGAIAIGNRAATQAVYTIAIGYHTYATYIGGIAIGMDANATAQGAISIGSHTYARSNFGVAFGAYSSTINNSIAIGGYSYAKSGSLAIGYNTTGNGNYSIALNAHGDGDYAIALGHQAVANFNNSTVIGAAAADACQASFVMRGGTGYYQGPIAPTTHAQKLFGTTIVAKSATAIFTDGATYTVIFTNDTPGSAGNTPQVLLYDNTGIPNSPLEVIIMFNDLAIFLGTDGDGNVNTTVADLLGIFPSNGYSATSETDGSQLITTSHPGAGAAINFSGGIDSVASVVLTADGQTPGANNLPATLPSTVSRATAQVFGYQPAVVTGTPGDSAVYTMTPTLVIRDNSSNYSFIGTPTFTKEAATDGAADWTVPTLTINSSTQLYLTVTGETADLNWLGFVSIESTQ